MSTVTWDTIENNRAVLNEDGWQFFRTAIVEGLAGTAIQRLVEAVAALDVVLGSVHPFVPYVFLRSIEPESISNTKARVRLTYSKINPREYPGEGETIIQLGSTVVQIETQTDKDGNILPTLSYTYPNEPAKYEKKAGETFIAQAKVSKMVPQNTYRIQTRLGYSPGPYAGAYVGCINDGFWKDGAAGTWLCTAITGVSRDGGWTYDCTFEFQYDRNTWILKAVFVDPDTGDAVTPTGDAVCDCPVYPLANFNGLPI